jgi:hypothetical protein
MEGPERWQKEWSGWREMAGAERKFFAQVDHAAHDSVTHWIPFLHMGLPVDFLKHLNAFIFTAISSYQLR